MTRPDLDGRLSTLLKGVVPEPPSELRFSPVPRAASSNWIRPALVAAAVLVVALTTFLVVRPAPRPGPSAPAPSAPSSARAAGCPAAGAPVTTVFAGGPDSAGPVRPAAPTPVVAAGSILRVVAELGDLRVSLPATSSSALRLLCTQRESSAYRAFFRVVGTSGTVRIVWRTSMWTMETQVKIANPTVPSNACTVGRPVPLRGITPLPHGEWAYHYLIDGRDSVFVAPPGGLQARPCVGDRPLSHPVQTIPAPATSSPR